ncbi:hypothetical protein BACCIP111895_03918 [Neobacillus rhizosphaerae]|uniref:Uncharacterized protein n=1 Tax=Neobacillus rhizosphaerae TaxID=2880965 RepID=A0ABN8KWB2_9BACI|nr:hypothetical protein BACCIP111895_03918 [Neobacillus rhizosphaerae]
MYWLSIVLRLISTIFVFVPFLMINQIRKDLKKLDKEQVIPDEYIEKWKKLLSRMIVFCVIGTILGSVEIIFR